MVAAYIFQREWLGDLQGKLHELEAWTKTPITGTERFITYMLCTLSNSKRGITENRNCQVERMTVLMEPATIRKLKLLAIDTNTSARGIIRDALANYLNVATRRRGRQEARCATMVKAITEPGEKTRG